jgi:hypothetical protein
VERLGLGVAALQTVQFSKVAKARGYNWMVGAERPLPDGQGSPEERLSFSVAALRMV